MGTTLGMMLARAVTGGGGGGGSVGAVDLWSATNTVSADIALPAGSVLPAGTQGGGFTLEAWVKMLVLDGSHISVILGFGNAAADIQMRIDGNGRPGLFCNGQGIGVSTGATFTAGTWHHFAGVQSFDPNTRYIRYFFDGAPISSPAGAMNPSISSTLRLIGGDGTASAARAKIAEVRVFNAPLSDATILARYNHFLTGSEANLAGYWPCRDGSGTTLHDSSAGAHDGTLSSGTDVTWSSDAPPLT